MRVYCGSASTTATFSGDTASYTLTVPAGDHAVTASVLGYKTTTQLETVTNGQNTNNNYSLDAVERRIEMLCSPERVPPDGTSEITVTAIVRDIEGKRFPNEAVTWSADLGTVVSSDTATDAVGEARLVLRAPSLAGTANVIVTSGSVSATAYTEFASATAPSVRILTPMSSEIVSGVVTVSLQASDPGGTDTGIYDLAVVVDGQPLETRRRQWLKWPGLRSSCQMAVTRSRLRQAMGMGK